MIYDINMIPVSDIKPGTVIEIDGNFYRVVSRVDVKPGKGGKFLQCILQNLINRQKREERFSTDKKVLEANVYEHSAVFIGKDRNNKNKFFDTELNDEIILDADSPFLYDNPENLKIVFINDNPINFELPQSTICQIKSIVTNSTHSKEALLTNGLVIKVNTFCKDDDFIIVNTETKEFVSKALKK